MKYHLIKACLNIKRCVPGAAIGSIKPVQFPWLCVGETRIDERRVWHPMDQLFRGNTLDAVVLGDEPGARGRFDFREFGKLVFCVHERFQNRVTQSGSCDEPNRAREGMAPLNTMPSLSSRNICAPQQAWRDICADSRLKIRPI